MHNLGEWECNYEEWGAIYEACDHFFRHHSIQEWNQEAIDTIFYIIARDNESQFLSSKLAEQPNRLLYLAENCLLATEADARWQIAVELGNLSERLSEAEPILLRLTNDVDEYVRRQALMALGRLQSPQVENLAAIAWNREEQWQEYQRMAVLSALRDTHSPLLSHYLEKAEADGRQYLTAYAAKI